VLEEVKTTAEGGERAVSTQQACDCCGGREHLHKMLLLAIEKQPRASELHTKLLSLGGTSALLNPAGSRIYKLDELLAVGQEWDGKKCLLRRGNMSECHQNAGRYWAASMGDLKIATGYALSNDGMWRAHSWNLRPDGYVLESTVPRVKYYGIIPDELDSFTLFLSNVFPTKIREMAERMEAGRSLT